MVTDPSYESLAEKLTGRLSPKELNSICRAYQMAERAHWGQSRDEGTPYIHHPLRVAIALVEELGIYDAELICAALLHDVIEDSATTREDIAKEFGERVAQIVWLLTKSEDSDLGQYLAAIEAAAHTGALTVKLCDRLDNMRSLALSPKSEKKRRYAQITEQYYLPLAARSNEYLHRELRRALEQLQAQDRPSRDRRC
jgi:(p)ppGpp synthase/HD superfamily hydrolase